MKFCVKAIWSSQSGCCPNYRLNSNFSYKCILKLQNHALENVNNVWIFSILNLKICLQRFLLPLHSLYCSLILMHQASNLKPIWNTILLLYCKHLHFILHTCVYFHLHFDPYWHTSTKCWERFSPGSKDQHSSEGHTFAVE